MNDHVQDHVPHTILGVTGHLYREKPLANGLFKRQFWRATRKLRPSHCQWVKRNADKIFTVTLRFDDQCGNRYQNFSATCWYGGENGGGGANHELIVEHFPELEPLMKWHLSSTKAASGIGNALFFAGNLDCSGRAAGQPRAWQDMVQVDGCPIPFPVDTYSGVWKWIRQQYEFNVNLAHHYSLTQAKKNPDYRVFKVRQLDYLKEGERVSYAPKYCFEGSPADAWYKAAFDQREVAEGFAEALNRQIITFTKAPRDWSKGKEREFDLARRAAIWPDASEEVLSLPKDELRAVLEGRELILMQEFKQAMTVDCGFEWRVVEEVPSEADTAK